MAGLQGADGSWDLTEELAKALGIGRGELEREFDAVMRRLRTRPESVDAARGWTHARDLPEGLCRRAFATALAVRWLHAACADTREEWDGLAQKAHEWLQKAPLGAEFWLEAARTPSVTAREVG